MVGDLFSIVAWRKVPEDVGNLLISWTFPEYEKRPRSQKWYILMSIVVVALLMYAVFTVNFLFAIIILLVLFIIIFQYFQQPRLIRVSISEEGVLIGKQFYSFQELQSFWFIYEPPVIKNLYLDFRTPGKRSLVVMLDDANPLMIREVLEQFLNENIEPAGEYFDETVARYLNIH